MGSKKGVGLGAVKRKEQKFAGENFESGSVGGN